MLGQVAVVAILEDIIAMGAENILVFGTCGVLDSNIKETSIIILQALFATKAQAITTLRQQVKLRSITPIANSLNSFLTRKISPIQKEKFGQLTAFTVKPIKRRQIERHKVLSPLIWNALRLPHLPTSARLIFSILFIRLTI